MEKALFESAQAEVRKAQADLFKEASEQRKRRLAVARLSIAFQAQQATHARAVQARAAWDAAAPAGGAVDDRGPPPPDPGPQPVKSAEFTKAEADHEAQKTLVAELDAEVKLLDASVKGMAPEVSVEAQAAAAAFKAVAKQDAREVAAGKPQTVARKVNALEVLRARAAGFPMPMLVEQTIHADERRRKGPDYFGPKLSAMPGGYLEPGRVKPKDASRCGVPEASRAFRDLGRATLRTRSFDCAINNCISLVMGGLQGAVKAGGAPVTSVLDKAAAAAAAAMRKAEGLPEVAAAAGGGGDGGGGGGGGGPPEPVALLVHSGDVVVLSGRARRCVHGVPRIFRASLPPWLTAAEPGGGGAAADGDAAWAPFGGYLEHGGRGRRINVSLRQVRPAGVAALPTGANANAAEEGAAAAATEATATPATPAATTAAAAAARAAPQPAVAPRLACLPAELLRAALIPLLSPRATLALAAAAPTRAGLGRRVTAEVLALVLPKTSRSANGWANAMLAGTFPNLRSVDLSGLYWNPFTTAAGGATLFGRSLGTVASHRCLEQLRALDVRFCRQLNDTTVIKVAMHCRKLEAFRAGGCSQLTKRSLAALAEHCPNLAALDVSGAADIVDAGLEAIARRCPKLAELNVRGCKKLTDAAIGLVGDRCPLLARLNASLLLALTSAGVARVAAGAGANLRVLDLGNSGQMIFIQDAALAAVAAHCPALEVLDIGHCNVSDEGVIAVARGAAGHLRELNLAAGLNLTDAALAAIGECCPNLETVNITYCTKVTAAGILALATGCAALRTLTMVRHPALQQPVVIEEVGTPGPPSGLLEQVRAVRPELEVVVEAANRGGRAPRVQLHPG